MRSMRALCIRALWTLLAGGAGCAHVPPPTAEGRTPSVVASPPTSSQDGKSSNDGKCYVEFHSDPTTLPLNEPFAMTVDVFDGKDRTRRAVDVDLLVDAKMPAHYHGMNRLPKTTKAGGGRFLIEGMLLHMPGQW